MIHERSLDKISFKKPPNKILIKNKFEFQKFENVTAGVSTQNILTPAKEDQPRHRQ